MKWPHPYKAIESPAAQAGFWAELQREVAPGHVLYGVAVEAIAFRVDQDGVVFRLLDGSGRIADVHLTYAARERPPWPSTELFNSIEDWEHAMRDEFFEDASD